MAGHFHHDAAGRGASGKLFHMRAWVYILRCSDGTLYTGWTNDTEKRLAAHNKGTASKYTRGRRPVEMIFKEGFETRAAAMSRESEIKALSRVKKLLLAEHASDTEKI
jgi:putative endonuclease